MVVSNPRAGDFVALWAYNHLPFNTGVHELPISYICSSPDGDTNCPIPTGYNCQLRDHISCAVGSSPGLYNGKTTPPTFENGYIGVPTADGGLVKYCVVCIAPDDSIACQDGSRRILAFDYCSSPSPGFSLSDPPPGDITLPFDSSTPEAKLQANTKTFYKDVSGYSYSFFLDYCRNAISTCKLVDMSGSDITIPNLRLGDKQDYFNLYLTMVSEG